MSAPTATELQVLFDARQARFPQAIKKLEEAFAEFFDLIDYRAPSTDPDDDFGELGNYVYTNLRPKEAVRLIECARVAQAEGVCLATELALSQLVKAIARFSSEYPDAPRQEKADLAA